MGRLNESWSPPSPHLEAIPSCHASPPPCPRSHRGRWEDAPREPPPRSGIGRRGLMHARGLASPPRGREQAKPAEPRDPRARRTPPPRPAFGRLRTRCSAVQWPTSFLPCPNESRLRGFRSLERPLYGDIRFLVRSFIWFVLFLSRETVVRIAKRPRRRHGSQSCVHMTSTRPSVPNPNHKGPHARSRDHEARPAGAPRRREGDAGGPARRPVQHPPHLDRGHHPPPPLRQNRPRKASREVHPRGEARAGQPRDRDGPLPAPTTGREEGVRPGRIPPDPRS